MNEQEIEALLNENARRAAAGEELIPFPHEPAGPVDADGDPVA